MEADRNSSSVKVASLENTVASLKNTVVSLEKNVGSLETDLIDVQLEYYDLKSHLLVNSLCRYCMALETNISVNAMEPDFSKEAIAAMFSEANKAAVQHTSVRVSVYYDEIESSSDDHKQQLKPFIFDFNFARVISIFEKYRESRNIQAHPAHPFSLSQIKKMIQFFRSHGSSYPGRESEITILSDFLSEAIGYLQYKSSRDAIETQIFSQ
jgi:hypothetical protein